MAVGIVVQQLPLQEELRRAHLVPSRVGTAQHHARHCLAPFGGAQIRQVAVGMRPLFASLEEGSVESMAGTQMSLDRMDLAVSDTSGRATRVGTTGSGEVIGRHHVGSEDRCFAYKTNKPNLRCTNICGAWAGRACPVRGRSRCIA